MSDLDHIRYVDDDGQWPGLTTLVMVEGERLVGGKTTVESRYYISSLPNDASVLLNAVRSHWSIENQLHWSLDVTFDEDGSRVRSGNGAENFSVLRRMALNLLKVLAQYDAIALERSAISCGERRQAGQTSQKRKKTP